MLEKTIENYLKKEVEARGGMCIKLDSSSGRGLPDRMCVLPYGQVIFIETKRPKNGQVSRYQEYTLAKINSLGVEAYLASSKEDIDSVLRAYDVRLYHFEEAETGDI